MGLSADVTWRELSLGSRDTDTGWRAKTYAESTVEAVLLDPQEAIREGIGVGYYSSHGLVGVTPQPMNVYDQIIHPSGDYYEIKTVKPVWVLDSFEYYIYTLTYLPLFQAEPASQTDPAGMPVDARYKTKDWLDTYANADHTWITENDGTTAADFATIYSNPPYPLELEFRAAASPVDGLYVIFGPSSTPMMDPVAKKAYGYAEDVPIKSYAIDGTDVTGVILANKMEKELRYVAETYFLGSLRSPSRMQPREISLGSSVLYETDFTLHYARDLT